MKERQFTTFNIGDSLFGIDILLVNEIIRRSEITPVYGAPAFVRGLINLRGQIVTVVNLSEHLGLGSKELTPKSRIIILKTTLQLEQSAVTDQIEDDTCPDIVGLVVDKLGDMETIEEKDISPPPANASGISGHLLEGVIRKEDSILVLLKVREILKTKQKTSEVLS